MSDIKDLEDLYDESTIEGRFMNKGMQAMFDGRYRHQISVSRQHERSEQRRNVPVTLPKLKFLED